MQIFSIILILCFTVYTLYRGFQSKGKVGGMHEDIANDPDFRVNFYKDNLKRAFSRTFVLVLVAVFIFKMDYVDLGFGLPTFDTEPLGPILTYVVMAILALYLFLLLISFFTFFKNRNHFNFEDGVVNFKEEEDEFRVILPTNRKEEKYWNLMAFSAGFNEEILFRAYLFALISIAIPDLHIIFIGVLTALIFGVGHLYQGIKGVITTSILGLVFVFAFVAFNSIIPLILLHWFIDYLAKFSKFDVSILRKDTEGAEQ